MKKLLKEGHIERLDKCTSDCFIAPIVITVKKDDSIKLALDAKPINRQLFKNKYQMPNVDELIDGVSQIVTANTNGKPYFSVLDLKYAYSQLKLTAETAKQCNFNIIGGQGVQKEAEKLLSQQMDRVDYSTPGFADESDKEEDTTTVRRNNRQTKNQGPKRYGSPVSHSIKLIGCEDNVTELNLAALEAYRLRLAKLNINNKGTSENNTFDRLERHLFKRKFGATSLDEAGSWNAARNKEEVLKKLTKD